MDLHVSLFCAKPGTWYYSECAHSEAEQQTRDALLDIEPAVARGVAGRPDITARVRRSGAGLVVYGAIRSRKAARPG